MRGIVVIGRDLNITGRRHKGGYVVGNQVISRCQRDPRVVGQNNLPRGICSYGPHRDLGGVCKRDGEGRKGSKHVVRNSAGCAGWASRAVYLCTTLDFPLC